MSWERGLVFDASVLIDYASHDPLLLGMVARHIAPVVIPFPVLLEVGALDEQLSTALGLVVVETAPALLQEAVARPRTLSFEDYLCFATARDLDLTCVTNDGALLAYCAVGGVATMRGFRPLIALVEAGHLGALGSFRIVRAVHQQNSYITRTVVVAFAQEILGARRRR